MTLAAMLAAAALAQPATAPGAGRDDRGVTMQRGAFTPLGTTAGGPKIACADLL